MKKYLFILFFSLFLIGCSNNKTETDILDKSLKKDSYTVKSGEFLLLDLNNDNINELLYYEITEPEDGEKSDILSFNINNIEYKQNIQEDKYSDYIRLNNDNNIYKIYFNKYIDEDFERYYIYENNEIIKAEEITVNLK